MIPPSWSIKRSETREEAACPWLGAETVFCIPVFLIVDKPLEFLGLPGKNDVFTESRSLGEGWGMVGNLHSVSSSEARTH